MDSDKIAEELREHFDSGLRENEYTLDMLYQISGASCAKGAFYRRFEKDFVDTGKYTKIKRIVNGKRVNAYKKK